MDKEIKPFKTQPHNKNGIDSSHEPTNPKQNKTRLPLPKGFRVAAFCFLQGLIHFGVTERKNEIGII